MPDPTLTRSKAWPPAKTVDSARITRVLLGATRPSDVSEPQAFGAFAAISPRNVSVTALVAALSWLVLTSRSALATSAAAAVSAATAAVPMP